MMRKKKGVTLEETGKMDTTQEEIRQTIQAEKDTINVEKVWEEEEKRRHVVDTVEERKIEDPRILPSIGRVMGNLQKEGDFEKLCKKKKQQLK